MKAVHRDVAPLLGAWASGACTPEQTALVLEHLAECDECARQSLLLTAPTDDPLNPPHDPPGVLPGFRGEAAGPSRGPIGVPGGTTGSLSGLPDSPDGAVGSVKGSARSDGGSAASGGAEDSPGTAHGALRGRILGAARGRRAPAPSVPGFAAAYAAQTSVLDALLVELSERDWATTVIYDWSVQDVVAHLGATDRIVAEQLDPGASRNLDVDASTAAAIGFERGRRPEETHAAWLAQSRALCARLSPADTARKVTVHQPMRLDNVMVARAFETWVHSLDIAEAVGRNLPSPLPQHLHAIAGLGVRALPAALASRGHRHEARARVVLDGPGGGEWLVTLGGDGAAAPAAPAVTVRLDALEFCLLAADRRDPSNVPASITGDAELGHHLLHSASAFAGP
jgi:uncharacterized protein (TIGR03083 family)